VLAQSGFYSADERRLHFGLGTATQADLEIRWPGGGVQRLPQVKADQVLVVEQPASA
jgi:enediyne biosynthesis protein E4